MERRLNKKVETYITTFKDSIREKATQLGLSNDINLIANVGSLGNSELRKKYNRALEIKNTLIKMGAWNGDKKIIRKLVLFTYPDKYKGIDSSDCSDKEKENFAKKINQSS